MSDLNSLIRAGHQAAELQQRLRNAEDLNTRLKIHLAIHQAGDALHGVDYAAAARRMETFFETGDLRLITVSGRFAGLPIVTLENGQAMNAVNIQPLLMS